MRILSDPSEVLPMVGQVHTLADQERKKLGFLPKRAYEQAASQGKIILCCQRTQSVEELAGYIFFGGTFPHARIFQLYVRPKFRRNGVGAHLLQHFFGYCEEQQFLSISIRVASDMIQANRYWQNQGFKVVKTTRGGKTTNRQIHVRVRDLATPSLLSLMQGDGVDIVSELHLAERLPNGPPLFVIDINVLLDIARKRPRANAAGKILQAGLKNTIRVAITEEFIEELMRNTSEYGDDPILQIASNFRRLPTPPSKDVGELFNKIASIVFPARYAENRLSVRDKSDITHILSTIHHDADGFVTSEKAILKKRNEIKQNFGVDLIGVDELAALTVSDNDSPHSEIRAHTSGVDIHAYEITGKAGLDIDAFLKSLMVDQKTRRDVLSQHRSDTSRHRLIVTRDDRIVGFGSWDTPVNVKSESEFFVCLDEDDPASQSITDYLFHHITSQLAAQDSRIVNVHLLPGHSFTRRIALAHGYRPAQQQDETGNHLQKFCIGSIVLEKNWKEFRERSLQIAGIKFEHSLPDAQALDSGIKLTTPGGRKVKIPLFELESLASPVLFLFSSRPGVIVPIRQAYSHDLFGNSPQRSMLDDRSAIFLRERAYVSTQANIKLLKRGTPILFYESKNGGGRGAIVAVARVTKSELAFKSDVDQLAGEQAVVDRTNIDQLTKSEKCTVTFFDNIFSLAKSVSIERLRSIGCADGANFVTARRISGPHIVEVISEGHNNG